MHYKAFALINILLCLVNKENMGNMSPTEPRPCCKTFIGTHAARGAITKMSVKML